MASDEHRGDEHGAFFGEITSEIKADYDALQQLVADLGADKSATKTAAAEVGSKMMTPEFVGGDGDELNAFVTLETLSIARGGDQRARIGERRLEIAPQALAHTANV